jgi:hypothetical protein
MARFTLHRESKILSLHLIESKTRNGNGVTRYMIRWGVIDMLCYLNKLICVDKREEEKMKENGNGNMGIARRKSLEMSTLW